MSQLIPGVIALITHARDVPAAQRERFAARIQDELAGRALVLETCHRVEAYWTSSDDPDLQAETTWLPAGGRILTGGAAVKHAMAVAVGRDSVVVGEDQVLHQLREAVDAARKGGRLDPALERLFALALQAGRRARSWRQGPQRSLADVALAAIERQTGSLRGRDILVVGAGRMGRLAVLAAAASGANVSLTSRSPERAESLAAATGALTLPFDPGQETARFAGVIVALSGPWSIGAPTIAGLAGSTIVVDLSVPPAVPGWFAEALGARFVSADAMALTEAEPLLLNRGWLTRLDALIERTTLEYLDWLSGHGGRATADALIQRADREREAELALLWRRLPDLQPEARTAIEGMARHLAQRLLREPLERLGRDSDGRDDQAVRDIFAL